MAFHSIKKNYLIGDVIILMFMFSEFVSCQELADALPCQSQIFCYGPLLEAAQNAYVFNDSKTFVDLHLKYPPDEVLAAFAELDNPSDPETMAIFVNNYFDGPDLEFIDWIPTDWKSNPGFLSKIKDDSLLKWAGDLHALWKELGRKIDPDVKTNQDRYTLIYVDEPFIVPGGRFREFYYWDSYWVIKGLLISEMTGTVRGMLSNFANMIDLLGFIPNGNRIYYERRSQPPFFIPSVYEYLKFTNDTDFIESILPVLEMEYQFWMTNRTVEVVKDGESYTLNRYDVKMGRPRPESYREDVETSLSDSEDESARICSDLAAGAESGWDFTSRWFADDQSEIESIRTKQIVPVDLNSILCMNEQILSELFAMVGNTNKSRMYMDALLTRSLAIEKVLWVEEAGVWHDYDLESDKNRDEFYPSNIMPMWANCFASTNGKTEIEEKVLNYLKRMGVLDYPGGIPTSLFNTGQQWDFPNAWPPLQEMTIQALQNSELTEAKEYALRLAQNWTTTNWKAYQETDVMFEKYDVEKQGVPGHGGEYEVQAGFGWTNGVMLTLLDRYGDKLVAPSIATRAYISYINIVVLNIISVGLLFIL